MSTKSISRVLDDLFSTPLNAAVAADKKYRKLWSDWIKEQIKVLSPNGKVDGLSAEQVESILDLTPVVQLDGVVDAAISLRIAAVSKHEGGADLGLQVGPVHIGGQYSFMSQKTEESIFQASASFTFSNTPGSLRDYLGKARLTPTDASSMENAMKFLDNQSPADGGGGE